MSLASDGKVSIAAGFTELGKKMGFSDKVAEWFGFGMNMAFVLAGVAASFGASAASSSSKVVEATAQAAEKSATAMSLLTKVSTATNAAQGGVGIATGVGNAAVAVINYQLAKIEANKVDIQAILERLRADFEASEDLLESQMETSQNVMNTVMEIVNECGKTNTAILSAAPSVA